MHHIWCVSERCFTSYCMFELWLYMIFHMRCELGHECVILYCMFAYSLFMMCHIWCVWSVFIFSCMYDVTYTVCVETVCYIIMRV